MFKSAFEQVWAEEAQHKQALAKASTPLHAASEAAVNAGAPDQPDGVTHNHGPWCYPDGKMPEGSAAPLPVSEDKPRDLEHEDQDDAQDREDPDVEKGWKRELRQLQRQLGEHLNLSHADAEVSDADPSGYESILPAGQPDAQGPAEMVGVPGESGDADISPDTVKSSGLPERGPDHAPSPGSAPAPRSLGSPGSARGGFSGVSSADCERYTTRPLPGGKR